MNLQTETRNDVVIIYVKEERLDAHNSGELKIEVQRLFEEGKKNVLVDLKDVRFIDSSGLGALVSGFKNAISHQGILKLSSLQSQVRSMFELTRLHRVFEIFSSTSEALDNF
ncbi:STAS domain-containing protein [Geotalea uraniireducens]|uniref:Anti-sigma factor antagonist n=1 Tax=Geotalea uraniireducens (strain Rf4) TaxID=351605 RepID=A5G366_GEOUR|nr:STAS domain-containing protein [Geotalea uraniireducens]ABQ26234.1 anti-sigma-factor antagonist [Geotalea uraniireducens Rf4]